MTALPSAGSVHLAKDKLRTITDGAWIREGSALKCEPLRGPGLQLAVENLAHFGLYADEVATRRGVALTLPLNEACTLLGAIPEKELSNWEKGIG